MKSFIILVCFAGLFSGKTSFAQTPSSYALPENYRFDYEVSQSLNSKKNAADSCTMHFFYTRAGDYAAAKFSGKENMKGNLFVVLTRDGICVIFDEHHKNITILSIRKLISDLAGMAKWIRMDSLMAGMRDKMNRKDFQSVKTGNHKSLGSYTTEEYSASDGRGGHKTTVWIAKVDFDTQIDYILGSAGGNFLKMMGGQQGSAHPLFQALTQPRSLITEIESVDSAGSNKMTMQTVSINPATTTVATSGYTVSNYSNMTFPEILQAEMKKHNN
jgi:hypothetical protein